MKKILVVDDDKKLRAALRVRLKAAEYEVVEAADGVEGLNLAVEHRPDLILLDVWMPNSVGPLMAQRLKHVGLAHVPVIFLTGAKRAELWRVAEELEPAGYFEKPYEPRELLGAIARLLAPPALSSPATDPNAITPPTAS
jgi:DNA-binding response OmpR family regulator